MSTQQVKILPTNNYGINTEGLKTNNFTAHGWPMCITGADLKAAGAVSRHQQRHPEESWDEENAYCFLSKHLEVIEG